MKAFQAHPADLADELKRLPSEEAREAIRKLPRDQAAAVLIELDREVWPDVLADLKASELVGLIEELPNDVAADLIQDLPLSERRGVLAGLTKERVSEVAALMKHALDTAGGIMSNQYLAFQKGETLAQCQEKLRNLAEVS